MTPAGRTVSMKDQNAEAGCAGLSAGTSGPQTSKSPRPIKIGDLLDTEPATNAWRPGTVVQWKKLPWLEKRRLAANAATDRVHTSGNDCKQEMGLLGNLNRRWPEHGMSYESSIDSLGGDSATQVTEVTTISKGKAGRRRFPLHAHHLQHHHVEILPASPRKRRPVVTAGHAQAPYLTSDYSASPLSDREPLPSRLPRKNLASYEKLISPVPSAPANEQNPFHKPSGPQHQASVIPLDEPVSPGNSTKQAFSSIKKLEPVAIMSPRQPHLRPHMRVADCPQYQPWLSSPEESSISSITPPPRPAKKPTLHGLPHHLLAGPRSSSRYRIQSMSGPKNRATAVEVPAVNRSAASLNRAVTGLENLMDEAIHVVRSAAKNGQPEEVANVINGATLALSKVSLVQSQMNQPLVLSSSADSMRSEDTIYATSSQQHSKAPSIETAATIYTKSGKSSMQPVLHEPFTQNSQVPVSQKGRVESCGQNTDASSQHESLSHTPPRLYAPQSAESFVRDFAYVKREVPRRSTSFPPSRGTFGLATDYYGDQGQSVDSQPGVRHSLVPPPAPAPLLSAMKHRGIHNRHRHFHRPHLHHLKHHSMDPEDDRQVAEVPARPLRRVDKVQQNVRMLEPTPIRETSEDDFENSAAPSRPQRKELYRSKHWQLPQVLESAYYRVHDGGAQPRAMDAETDQRRDPQPSNEVSQEQGKGSEQKGSDALQPQSAYNLSLRHPRRHHISLKEGEGFSLGRYHKRQPIAREWNPARKAITAAIACLNTVFVGFIAGVYAGEVPRIQYQLADMTHWVINGNVVLFAGLGLTTLIFWPLPLLHGRKPYILLSFALMLPLQFPQAIIVSNWRPPKTQYQVGLLLPRALTGLALGFANINFLPTLFDLFGASLMSERPHQEVVLYDDVRRQGGGMGIWLGIWTFCFSSSLSLGFCVGACIISKWDPAWGFYIVVILLAVFLLINVIAPETRRSPYRRSIAHFVDDNDPERLKRRVARGEIKLHISNDGPKW